MHRLDVDEMLTELTPQEFDEWVAYNIVEPFDDGWMQAGIIASIVQNAITSAVAAYSGKRLRKTDFVSPADFTPGAEKPSRRRQTADDIRSQLEGMINRGQDR